MMDKKHRLTGLDLCRGIAIYAVVVQHSGDETWAEVGYWAATLRSFCSFAVPFFLATSFYLMTRKLYIHKTQFSLSPRVERLLIPYTFWSAFYIALKSIRFLILNESSELKKLFLDPISLIFIGGSSVQLYFLPLLLTGTLLIPLTAYLIKKNISIEGLILLLIVSLATYEVILVSGNSFQLGSNVAFDNLVGWILPDGNKNPVIRLIFVVVAFLIRCFPYLTAAMLLNHLLLSKNSIKLDYRATLPLLATFILVNSFGKLFLASSVYEIVRAFSFLLFGLYLSEQVKENRAITNLGLCSFGIYLIHPFMISVLEIFVGKVYPSLLDRVSIFTLLTFSIPSFFIAWLVVSLLMKRKWLAKFIFGS